MAFTFPLSLANFFGGLRLLSCDLMLPAANEMHRAANGEIHEAYLGSRLWEGTVSLAPMSIRDGEALRAKFALLRQPGASFLMHPFPTYRPAFDPKGTFYPSASATIYSLGSNNREMQLTGLPEAYRISPGDFLSFAYGSPAKQALHQVVSASVWAASTGITPLFEVVPYIRPGAATSAAVTIIKPVMKAILTDVQMGSIVGPSRYGVQFSFIQKVKAG